MWKILGSDLNTIRKSFLNFWAEEMARGLGWMCLCSALSFSVPESMTLLSPVSPPVLLIPV